MTMSAKRSAGSVTSSSMAASGTALEQEPVVLELGEDDHAIAHGVGATAVLVDAGAHVESGRHVGERAVGRTPQQHDAAGLLGSRLEKVDVGAIGPWLGQTARGADGHVDADRRRPGAVGKCLRMAPSGDGTAPRRDTCGRMTDVVIAPEPADSPDVRWCFGQYYAELGRRFGYAVEEALPLGLDELTPPHGLVLIAREAGTQAVGCGAVKLQLQTSPRSSACGSRHGCADAVSAASCWRPSRPAVCQAGKSVARFETNEGLEVALAMYRARGYRDIEPFNDEPFATHWLEKDLLARPRQPDASRGSSCPGSR